MNKYREFEIDLTTCNDCEFVVEVVKNNKNVLVELYSYEFDGDDHMTSVIYVDVNETEKFYENNSIFENMSYEDYELDEDCEQSLIETCKPTIDDIKNYGELLKKIDLLHERYSVETNRLIKD